MKSQVEKIRDRVKYLVEQKSIDGGKKAILKKRIFQLLANEKELKKIKRFADGEIMKLLKERSAGDVLLTKAIEKAFASVEKHSEKIEKGGKDIVASVADVESAIRGLKLPEEVHEVTIKNPSDFPVAESVSVSNLGGVQNELKEIKESSLRQEKEAGEDKVLFFEMLKECIKAIGVLLSKITFKVQPTALHYDTPQKVIIYDPISKRAITAKDIGGKNTGQAFSTVVVDTESVTTAIEAQLTNYKVSDVDDAGTTKYYGFLRANGYWYILQENTAVAPKTYRYTSGLSGYTTSWTGRTGLTYGYFDATF